MSSLMMESKVTIGVNAEIIHINLQPFLSYHVGKEVVHESLEGGWCVTGSKEHHSWFEESKDSDEGSFPLVFLMDTDLVVTPSNVECHEAGGIFDVINELRDER